uniref:(northern house mosquito) hypothetical protein n=1 Tax=Culex pipiens TaxID=7175 RepID=A0A8D8EXN7_CULPI
MPLPPTPTDYQWAPDNDSLLRRLSKLNRNSHVETRLCSAPVVMICTNRCSTRVRCNCSKLRDRLNSQLLTAALRNLRLNPRLTESPKKCVRSDDRLRQTLTLRGGSSCSYQRVFSILLAVFTCRRMFPADSLRVSPGQDNSRPYTCDNHD